MFTRCADRGGARAFTLVEVLVAAALGSMVLYVIVALLIPALRVSGQGTAKVDLDQRAALIDERLTRALKSTTRAGVGRLPEGEQPDPLYLSVHPLLGTLTGSRQDWSRKLTVFVWKDQKFQEMDLDLPADPPPITAITLPLATLQEKLATARLRFTSDGVSKFKVDVSQGPQVDISFTLEKGTQSLDIERTVYLVNSSQ